MLLSSSSSIFSRRLESQLFFFLFNCHPFPINWFLPCCFQTCLSLLYPLKKKQPFTTTIPPSSYIPLSTLPFSTKFLEKSCLHPLTPLSLFTRSSILCNLAQALNHSTQTAFSKVTKNDLVAKSECFLGSHPCKSHRLLLYRLSPIGFYDTPFCILSFAGSSSIAHLIVGLPKALSWPLFHLFL